MANSDYDWKSNVNKHIFPYSGNLLSNKKYLKERSDFFAKSGNGWWWFPNDSFRREWLKKMKEAKDEM